MANREQCDNGHREDAGEVKESEDEMNIRLRNEKGSALLLVMLLIVMVTLLSVMSANRATVDIDLSYNQSNSDKAFYAAEAGVMQAYAKLNDSISWRAGFPEQQIGSAVFSVKIVDSVTQPALGDTVVVVSTGGAMEASASVQVSLIPRINRPFEFAVFARDRMRMEDFSCTDSYNSDSGSYAETQLDSLGAVGTNGELRLENNVVIGGDVVIASGGSYSIDPGVTLLGNLITDQPPVVLDPIPQSEFDWAKENNSSPAGLSGSGFSFSGDSLKIEVGGSLTLAGGVYYFDEIKLENLGAITVAPGEQVTIYMGNDILMEDNSSINLGGQPKNFVVFSQAGSNGLRLEDNAEFWGAFYGPDAEFKLEDHAQVYGSVVAGRSIAETLGAGGQCFHYDRDLMNYAKGRIVGMDMVAWREQ
ncbi:MAG: hypothetical protein IH914_07495 [candidate division Zixibacteria bacterium]|nr:hypothetical protein [candidate division Zixibacteria bacterium]